MAIPVSSIIKIGEAIVDLSKFLRTQYLKLVRQKKHEEISYDPVAYAKRRGVQFNEQHPFQPDLRNGIPVDSDVGNEGQPK